MKNIDTIVTHKGSAHIDDFLSICLCLYFIPTIKYIKRISSDTLVSSQKPENEIWVDIGKDYSKELNIFDHHQIDYKDYDGKEEVCSFNLLAMHFFNLSYSELQNYIPQFRYLALNDNLGPIKAMEALVKARNENNLFATDLNYPNIELRSILDITLLDIFSTKDSYDIDDGLIKLMKLIGTKIAENIERIQSFKKVLKENNILKYYFTQSIVYLDKELPSSLLFVLYEFLFTLGIKPKFIISKSSQDNNCLCALRTKYCNIDLNCINNDKIKFIHKTGFMAVWHSNITKEEIVTDLIHAIKS